jgi:type II secretory pathway component PulJ
MGFSLLEALVATAIFGTVMVGLCTVYATSHRSYSRGSIRIEAQQNVRAAIGVAARDIRHAGYDPSDVINTLPTTAIEVAAANTITLVGDVDGDDVTDKVTYRRDGNRLIQEMASWVSGAWSTAVESELADDVVSLSFAYYDENDNVTATLADIRRVTIYLAGRETAGDTRILFPLTLDARLRNL